MLSVQSVSGLMVVLEMLVVNLVGVGGWDECLPMLLLRIVRVHVGARVLVVAAVENVYM